MLDNCKTKEEHRDGVQKLIKRWLAARQELIVLYCSVSGVNCLAADCSNSTIRIKLFCQVLMDYVSAGHFEVYDQLLTEAENFQDSSELLLQDIYPKLSVTTAAILKFNDIFDTDEHCIQAIDQLKTELSTLGEQLTNRFAYEDRLINGMHSIHATTHAATA